MLVSCVFLMVVSVGVVVVAAAVGVGVVGVAREGEDGRAVAVVAVDCSTTKRSSYVVLCLSRPWLFFLLPCVLC